MTTPGPKRLFLLSGIAVVLAVVVVSRWISGWGLVTIHVKDAPVGKVISSIARQAHVRVESSLDPSKVVSMDVDKVPLAEALEVLAIRLDASWRAVFLTAPGKPDLEAAILQLRESGKISGWVTAYYPDRWMGVPAEEQAMNPVSLEWKAEGPELELTKLLDEAAQKTGVMTSLPKEWNPPVRKLPKPAAVGAVIGDLAGSVRGKVAAIYLVTARERGGRGDQPGPSTETQADATPRATPRPEWIGQRQEARIRKLPPAKRAEAKKEMDEAKSFFASLKDLPPEERRAKIQERMRDPALAEKMDERRLLRDSMMTAQQRIQRATSYISRKASIQKGPTP